MLAWLYRENSLNTWPQGDLFFVSGPTDGDSATIIQESGVGLTAGFDDIESIKDHVKTFYTAFKRNKLVVSPAEINRFSRPELTRNSCCITQRNDRRIRLSLLSFYFLYHST